VIRDDAGALHGVEAVVDKDLTAALLARDLAANAARTFPAGSMGPKVEAACRFVEATGGMAAIGRLDDAEALLDGKAGTIVVPGS
jgi:carbamate kinase